MGVMNRFKDMFKGEDEYDVDGYNDGYGDRAAAVRTRSARYEIQRRRSLGVRA